METTINQRIYLLIRHFCDGNNSAFGRLTGINPAVLWAILKGRLSNPAFESLQKIALACPAVSTDWLLLGHGEMLKPTKATPTTAQAKEVNAQKDEVIQALLGVQTKIDSLIVSIIRPLAAQTSPDLPGPSH